MLNFIREANNASRSGVIDQCTVIHKGDFKDRECEIRGFDNVAG